MGTGRNVRRRFVQALAHGAAAIASGAFAATRGKKSGVFTVVTLGDSILDCARYNNAGVHPGQLIVRNNDHLFPAFKGRDLASLGPTQLDHRARDGGRLDDLPRQAQRLVVQGPAVALITIGGNDLIGGLAADSGPGIARFEQRLDAFLRALPIRPVLLGNVYDPTFGQDARNFLGVDVRLARSNFNRVNRVLAALATRYGQLVDLHGHFLRGDSSWFTQTIEPSLRGASEVRAAFLPSVLKAHH